MNNAKRFNDVFGIYAIELWAMPEKEFIEWLNAKADLSAIRDESLRINKAYDDGYKTGYEQARFDYEQKWIPVTERLPEDEQNVLVTYKTTDKIHPCQYHADGSKNPWYSYIDQCRAHMNVVLAWMPLPEPYKGEA